MALRKLAGRLRRRLSRRFASWEVDSLGLARRRYKDYGGYLRHQVAKLGERPDTVEYFDRAIAEALPQRIADLELETARVVCVAARRGGEVRAFRSLGAFAWGVDIAPGRDNAYVAFGDMHNLGEIPRGSADLVYSNSLDHSFDLAAVVEAASRVLRPGGMWIVEVMERNDGGDFESRRWNSADEVVAALTAPRLTSEIGVADRPFRVVTHNAFKSPWRGVHVRLEKPA